MINKTNTIAIIFLFIFLCLANNMNAYSYVNFVTETNQALQNEGFILIEHDSTTALTCILETENLNENLTTSNTISVASSPYNIYYYGVGNGYVTFSVECGDGVNLYSDTNQYFIPVKQDSFEYVIGFILLLITPLLMKPLGLLDKITNKNIYIEFVLFAIILIIIFLYTGNTSAYHNELITLMGRTFALIGLLMSFWFIITETISNFNRGGVK